ncbi:LPS assembly lipoprotein LptE [Bartonella florencae]|uniref:LPS assembly lipoprotein LptE n=1 Tax=Bartonella florencae TaxID=928210 RepID=UPI0005643696|nr:LPS assembly lipoprotein LptE [Bartonella florencae]
MSFFKSFLLVSLAALFPLFCGCKIEPLYHEVSQISPKISSMDFVSSRRFAGAESLGLSKKLASIVIAEPSDRFGQMVRNHLLFLLYGGGRKPSAPAYQLILQTSLFTRDSVQIEIDRDRKREGRPSVGTVVGKASYILQDMKNMPVTNGMGTMSASFERLRQEYATMQAEENARRRVAEELAEQILMLLSRDLAKH